MQITMELKEYQYLKNSTEKLSKIIRGMVEKDSDTDSTKLYTLLVMVESMRKQLDPNMEES